jgi:hypothetical protein
MKFPSNMHLKKQYANCTNFGQLSGKECPNWQKFRKKLNILIQLRSMENSDIGIKKWKDTDR